MSKKPYVGQMAYPKYYIDGESSLEPDTLCKIVSVDSDEDFKIPKICVVKVGSKVLEYWWLDLNDIRFGGSN